MDSYQEILGRFQRNEISAEEAMQECCLVAGTPPGARTSKRFRKAVECTLDHVRNDRYANLRYAGDMLALFPTPYQ